MIERRGGVIQEAINLEFCGAEDYTAIGISVGKGTTSYMGLR